jgi:hypothetical protein
MYIDNYKQGIVLWVSSQFPKPPTRRTPCKAPHCREHSRHSRLSSTAPPLIAVLEDEDRPQWRSAVTLAIHAAHIPEVALKALELTRAELAHEVALNLALVDDQAHGDNAALVGFWNALIAVIYAHGYKWEDGQFLPAGELAVGPLGAPSGR